MSSTITIGGMEVYLDDPICTDENFYQGKMIKQDKMVSIKLFSKKDFPDYRDRIEREKKVVRNICRDSKMARIEDFDIECDSNFYYVAYEPFKTNLKNVIKNKNREKYVLKRILLDALEGLESLHNRVGQPHRDVRSQNILIAESANGNCGLISNYALSKEYQPGCVLQSISRPFPPNGYIAPELFKNYEGLIEESSKQSKKRKKVIDNSVDIFSLGIVMFEAFSLGSHPFQRNIDDDPQDNINKNKLTNFNERLLKLKEWEVPFAFKLIRCMMQNNSIKRPTANQIINFSPLFWNDKKTEEFFIAVQGYFLENKHNRYVIKAERFDRWNETVENVVKFAIINKTNFTEVHGGTYNLLASIRNLASHFQEEGTYVKNFREFLKANGHDGVIAYILTKFPALFPTFMKKCNFISQRKHSENFIVITILMFS